MQIFGRYRTAGRCDPKVAIDFGRHGVSCDRRRPILRRLAVLAFAALSACSPAELAGKVSRHAAESVVQPVVNINMPAGVANEATACILDAGSPAEVDALARDLGVEAGSSTKARIRELALRPAAQACFAARGVPPLQG